MRIFPASAHCHFSLIGMCVFSHTCTCLCVLKVRGLQGLPLPLSILFFEARFLTEIGLGVHRLLDGGGDLAPTGSGATVTVPEFMWVLWICTQVLMLARPALYLPSHCSSLS